MAEKTTRRGFLGAVAAGEALGLSLSFPTAGRASTAHEAHDPAGSPGGPRRQAVKTEMRRRARWQLGRKRLVVDYYRIGRKIAYPLPLESLLVPEVRVPSIPTYPWATWLLWTLEERIDCLGWAAEWFGDEPARQAAAADLAALAAWKRYHPSNRPGLSSAHAGRILWTAFTRWSWLDEGLRRRVDEACVRHVEAVLPGSDQRFGSVRTKDDVLRRDAPHTLLHNIPLIGTLGGALTAAAVDHPAAARLNDRVHALFGAVLDLRSKGHSEGVAYDGYVLDFVADWLTALSQSERSAVLDHPNLEHYLEQSTMLGAPGAVERVAELSDVEPREMPFHLSAQAKLLRMQRKPVQAWLLERCPLDVLRSDALAALAEVPEDLPAEAPTAGALDAHYAAVLRNGWEADDLAVAVSCSRSPMSHIQNDSGTLVIGTRGHWLVTDPGYQQYVRGQQREFTVGPTAHNGPLVNGHGPSRKQPRRIALGESRPSVHRVAIDLTACYAAQASLQELVRHVWLSGKELVVVADVLAAAEAPHVTYHWHGAREAAWWFDAGWALMTLGDARLWITCSQRPISGADLHRLPGSRGQLSLVSMLEAAGPAVWWVFAAAAERPELHVDADRRQIRLLDQTFRLGE